MDAIVTARVPVEIREQGNAVLRDLGATPTQLINAAYEYVLANKALPSANATHEGDSSPDRVVTTEMLEAAQGLLDVTTFPVPEDAWQGKSYKQVLEEGRKADYEALA